MIEETLRFPDNVPSSEFSMKFAQGMADRMSMSYFKYGRVAEAYPSRVDAIASLKLRLERYEETGNTEFLIDAANFAMIEFMRPKHPEAHFDPKDSGGGPGRIWNGEIDPSHRPNKIEEFSEA